MQNIELRCSICGKLAKDDSRFYPSKMLCNRHYIQLYRHGKILDAEKKEAESRPHVCDVCGDTSSKRYTIWHHGGEYDGKMLCQKHYAQMIKHGQIINKLPPLHDERICQICGSTNRVIYSEKFHGLFCQKHYSQLYNLGELKEETVFDRNKYEIKGDTVEIILKNQKFEETGRAIIDIEDFDKIICHKWHLGTWGYAETRDDNKTNLLMQRLVLDEYDPQKIPDHINRNPLDNRKSNLRIANKSDNAANSKLPRTNTSGIKGVSWNKNANAWRAYITKDGTRYELGYSKDFNKAVQKRLMAEKEYFGEFAPQKHLYEEYGIT